MALEIYKMLFKRINQDSFEMKNILILRECNQLILFRMAILKEEKK